MEHNIVREIEEKSSVDVAKNCKRFFKTNKGEYGYGDLFYGCRVPELRKIAKCNIELPFDELEKLLKNPYHEIRLCALLILVYKFQKTKNEALQKQIVDIYMQNIIHINNWDLVDLSCYHILGAYTYKNSCAGILYNLSKSNHLWSERISIVSTYYFIKQNEFQVTLELAENFLSHEHDLIQKASGWMLREVGKKNIQTLYRFLDKFYTTMPRTTLRYAIEKFSPEKKAYYMKK